MGIERTIGAGGPSRGVDQLLQYWRQVLDQDQRPVEAKRANAQGQAKQDAAVAQQSATSDETGWDRQARALEQVGSQDLRSQRWASFTGSPDASASVKKHVQGADHRAIPEAPIGRGARRQQSAGGGAASPRSHEPRSTAKLGVRPVSVHRPEGAFGRRSGAFTIA